MSYFIDDSLSFVGEVWGAALRNAYVMVELLAFRKLLFLILVKLT